MMNSAPKIITLIEPVSKTAGSTATGYVGDTMGYDHAIVTLHSNAAGATTKATVLNLTEGDTTDATNHATFTGYVAGTNFTIPEAQTSAHTLPDVVFSVPLQNRKRYLGLAVSPGTTVILCATVHLSKAERVPVTAAQAGAMVVVGF